MNTEKTMTKKPTLLASSGTFDGIKQCIAKFYCMDSTDSLWIDESGTVHRIGKGPFKGVRVISKRGRYRFEMVP